MSTTASAPPAPSTDKRDYRGNTLPGGRGLRDWLAPYLRSCVGLKFIVALTGAGLVAFVIAHLLGNLSVFRGREALNDYAHFLKSNPSLLWSARLGLLAIFVIHIAVSVRLRLRAQRARPIPYAHEQTIQASLASRTMIWTGVAILAFVIFHIAHYTLGLIQTVDVNGVATNLLDLRDPVSGHHDVYAMTWYGFHSPILSILYIVAQLFLIMHLSHGVSSMFQTLGLNTPRIAPALRIFGWAVALFVGLGNILIVLAVWLSLIPAPPV